MQDSNFESPRVRYSRLKKTLRALKVRAKLQDVPFSILCFGSGSYGLNPTNPGKFDDLDLFMVVPTGIEPEDVIRTIRKLFPKDLLMNEDHIINMLTGECDMCRLYARVGGVKVGFRLIHHHTLVEVSYSAGCNKPLRNIASLGQSRILSDEEWSFVHRAYAAVMFESYSKMVAGEQVLTVLQRVFSADKTCLGTLGRKLLTCHVVYESKTQNINSILLRIWKMFVDISLMHHGKLSNDDIINSITRSERFSKGFRVRLSRIIDSCRV
jgi:hypothetical protein